MMAQQKSVQIIINARSVGVHTFNSRDQLSKVIGLTRKLQLLPPGSDTSYIKIKNSKNQVLESYYKLQLMNESKVQVFLEIPQQLYVSQNIEGKLNDILNGKAEKPSSGIKESGVRSQNGVNSGTYMALKRIFQLIRQGKYDAIEQLRDEKKIQAVYIQIFLEYVAHVRRIQTKVEVCLQLLKIMLAQAKDQLQVGQLQKLDVREWDPKCFLEDKDRQVFKGIIKQMIWKKNNEDQAFIKQTQDFESQLTQLTQLSTLNNSLEHRIKEQEQTLMQQNEKLKEESDRLNSHLEELKVESGLLIQLRAQYNVLKQQLSNKEQQLAGLKKQLNQPKIISQSISSMHSDSNTNKQSDLNTLKQSIPNSCANHGQNKVTRSVPVGTRNNEPSRPEHVQSEPSIVVSSQLQTQIDLLRLHLDKSLLMDQLANTTQIRKILEYIENIVHKKVNYIKKLYHFEPGIIGPTDRYHSSIKKHHHLLLVARTQKGLLVGGFSTAPLQPIHVQPQFKNSGFLFVEEQPNGKLVTCELKEGCRCWEYDVDFIVFGREELCIDRKTLEVTSGCALQQHRHFDSKQLDQVIGKNGTRLSTFGVATIVFNEQ